MNRIIQHFLLCFGLASVTSAFAQGDIAGAIVVDNPAAELDGSWSATKSSVDRFGPDYHWSSSVAGDKPSATAIFRPSIPVAGKYNIEVMYPAGDNRSRESKWLISFDGGKEEVVVNQKVKGGQWVPIAKEKPMAAGTAGFVQLGNNTGALGSIVIADAVRFIPVGGSAPVAGNAGGFALKVNPAYGGTVATSPNQSSFDKNAQVTLTAKPNDGYVFDGWTGDASGWKNPLRLTMNSNKAITANFIAAGVGVIMDNPSAEKEGKWQISSTAWAGTWYDDYDFSMAKPKADAFITYRPNLPKSGKYDVYIRYAQGSNRSTRVPWSVSHKGGVVKAIVNQQTRGGEWFQIADGVEFDAGKKDKQFVQVDNGTGTETAGAMVVADAVAFVYVGGSQQQ